MQLPEFLTEDPDGEIHFTGRRMGLYTFVRYYREEGWTAEKFAEEYPDYLPGPWIEKTIAFYLENRAEVDTYFEQYRAELERQEAAHVPGPEQLRIRQLMEDDLRAKDGQVVEDNDLAETL